MGSPRAHALWHRWSHVVFVCVSNLWGRAVGGRIVLNEGSSGCSIHKSRIRNASRWEDRKTLTSLVVGVIGKHMVTSASWQKKISLVSHHSNVFLVNARVIITPTNLYYKCHCGLLWGLSSASWSSLTWFFWIIHHHHTGCIISTTLAATVVNICQYPSCRHHEMMHPLRWQTTWVRKRCLAQRSGISAVPSDLNLCVKVR